MREHSFRLEGGIDADWRVSVNRLNLYSGGSISTRGLSLQRTGARVLKATAPLDELLKLPGVMAAGEFSPDDKLVDYKAKMEMSRELASMTAQFARRSRSVQHAGRGVYPHEQDTAGVSEPSRLAGPEASSSRPLRPTSINSSRRSSARGKHARQYDLWRFDRRDRLDGSRST